MHGLDLRAQRPTLGRSQSLSFSYRDSSVVALTGCRCHAYPLLSCLTSGQLGSCSLTHPSSSVFSLRFRHVLPRMCDYD